MSAQFSIITPSYNSADFIAATVSSVIAQTFKDWEMIIVDDYSTDNSVECIQKLIAQDSRIKLIQLKQNSDAAVARNTGIQAAKGRFIAFLDSDDLWHPDKLERQIDFMLKGDIAFSYTGYEKINEDGIPFQIMGVPTKVSYNDLLKTNVIGCLTAIYDTEKLGKIYMPSNTKREDFAAWLNILKNIDYAYGINEPLAQYRVYAGQSSSKKASMAKENWHLYRNIQQLGFLRSTYYFSHYLVRGLLRTKFPKLAKSLKIIE